jgi:hypothetical protein
VSKVSSFPRNKCLLRCRETAHRAFWVLRPSVVSVSIQFRRVRNSIANGCLKGLFLLRRPRLGGHLPCPLSGRPLSTYLSEAEPLEAAPVDPLIAQNCA